MRRGVPQSATARSHPVPSELDERLLVEAAQRDPARFANLYDGYFDRVYAYVASRLRDRNAAEDVTAQVFCQVLDNIRKFEWRDTSFLAWLLAIAANAVTSHFRRTAREQGDPAAEPVDEKALAQVERQVMLANLTRNLSPDQRRVVMMRFVEERSIGEIATALNRSEGAVKQLQLRALQNLRKLLSNAATSTGKEVSHG